MDWTQRCAVVIPCFNEADQIGEVVAEVRRRLPKVIVVDDGSTDHSARQAEAGGAEVLRLPSNYGKGNALRLGWRHAAQLGFSWVLTMDGDGQHAPSDLEYFFVCAEATGAPLVVGNRLDHAEAMPWLRRQVNRWMTQRISRLTGVGLADSQCGFRLVRLDALRRVSLLANHFEIESDQLVAFIAAGYRIEFVPIQVIYKQNHSKIHPLVDAWRWFRWWMRWQARRVPLRSRPCGSQLLGLVARKRTT